MRGAIDNALEQITTAIGDLRSLITELRPAALDELGTKPALETLVARVMRQTDIEIALDIDLAYDNGDAASRHAPEIESAVYRIVQEALNNVAKHAAATRVDVSISDRGGDIALVVRDNGDGFAVQQRSTGFGLLGMRERLALVGGTLEIDSEPGAGTVVRASIPVRRRGARDGGPRRSERLA
jgi:signal transduction histidine kinase